MKIAVITALTGNKDTLSHHNITDGADFYAFCDQPIESEDWKVLKACDLFHEPRRNAKIHKVLSHMYIHSYDYTLWIDANISITAPAKTIIEKFLGDKEIGVWKHYGRNCLYDEAETCYKMGIDNLDYIKDQVFIYNHKGFARKQGLGECNVIARKHTREVEKLNNEWWAHICRFSSRDQISFPYVFRDKANYVPGNPRNHGWFLYNQHNYDAKYV